MSANFIIPPYLLEHLERTARTPELRAKYRESLEKDAGFRRREATPPPGEAVEGADRQIYDAENGTSLPGRPVRAEGEPPSQDGAVNEAYDGTGATWKMFKECFDRDSIDGEGLQLRSTVHYDRDYANAFWDGSQMVFGDGDGEIFQGFTRSVDVTGHELTHGVTQHTANLAYEGQSGALNESISDVFGSLAKQYQLGKSAAEADWIIGADLFQPGVNGVGLRSMKEPGTAYDDPRLGKDPQPAHMDDYVQTTEDNGGVHINSGIPNRAFYLAAMEMGGRAYEDPGKIWYHTLTSDRLSENATFAEFATATSESAKELYGADSPQYTAVINAWQEVGVDHGQTVETPSPELLQAARRGLDTERTRSATPPPPPPVISDRPSHHPAPSPGPERTP